MIIAGEASGDLHGASLIEELKRLDPSLSITGIGGDKMESAGMEIIYHIKKMAFLGFVEIIRHLPFIKKVQKDIVRKIRTDNIDTVVLIDYPGFNLSLAKKLRPLGKKIIYYISPQVWAWGKGRIKKIKVLTDKMLVVFPFEEKLYKDNGVDAVYVGHPLLEHIENYQFNSKDELFDRYKLDRNKRILLVLPGSRKQEIKKIFPETISASVKLAKDFNMQVVVACAENIDSNIFYWYTQEKDFAIIKGNTYDLLKYSHFGIIKSGTSTLEAGIFQLPFIVVYATSSLTYLIGKLLVSIKNIAMANIILGENAVEELIQHDVNSTNIYSTASKYLLDDNLYNSLKNKLGLIKNKLGKIGASKFAAGLIYEQLNEA